MFQATMSNSTLSEEATHHLSNTSFNNPLLLQNTSNNNNNNILSSPPPPKKVKKKRNLPGNPDPDAEVIALSPKSLLATNRFICEICNKGFQRDQNLQLHRRGHNLPWKLKQRNKLEVVRKKAYVCPEPSCVHHHPSRALGDLTGIKKHFCRKHGEKKFKCEKCSKIYAVHSDWKAHSKTCGTREYRCDCGTLFSRKDSFITHRAFCDALAEESARLSTNPFSNPLLPPPQSQPNSAPPPPFPTLSTSQQNPNNPLYPFPSLTSSISLSSSPWDPQHQNPNHNNLIQVKTEMHQFSPPPPFFHQPPHLFSKGMLTSPFTSDTNTITAHFLSATALLQKASTVGTSIQQSQQSQQAQAMLMNGFDELGASFRHVGGPTTANADMSMSTMLPPQSPSSTTTTTATTTTTNNNTHHHQNNNTTTMGMGMGMEMGMGMRMTPGSFATWRKNEDITRDFLGLTAGEQYSQSNGGGGGGRSNTEGGFEDEDDMVGNMLKFTGGLQYGMTAPYDRDNSSPTSPSPSSSSVLLKPHHQQSLVHHHQQLHDHQQGSFGNFVSSEPPTAATASDSRWG